jgi:hypothetical protein
MSCSAAYALAEQSCEVFVNAHKGALPMSRRSPDHALGLEDPQSTISLSPSSRSASRTPPPSGTANEAYATP